MLLLLILIGVAIIGRGLWNATRDPIVRRAYVGVADWPANAPPVTVLLLSDVHVAGPDMPPERLDRLVRGFNALQPDLFLIAGDLHSGKAVATSLYSTDQIAASLARLRAPLGTIAMLGNHDYWYRPQAQAKALRDRDVTVLANQAVRRGPLIVGGIADEFTRHADIPATYAAMDALDSPTGSTPRILVTHGPDVVPDLPRPVAALFAGHTHCGQIVLPLIGRVATSSRYGARFACGDMTDNGQRLFVGAGLGTSILPLRYGAPPDVWLVTLGPAVQQQPEP